MGRPSRDMPERDVLLLRARRLRLAVRDQSIRLRGTERTLSGIDRLSVRGLADDLGRLVVALKAEMTAIDAELSKVSRQAQAALMYSKANRQIGPSGTLPKDRSRR